MESKITIKKHSVHRMLVAFPVGLLVMSVIADIVFFMSHNPQWSVFSKYLLGTGFLTGLIAAPFGWADWFSIPKNTEAKKVGLAHGLGNVLVLVLFGVSFVLRATAINDTAVVFSYILSFTALSGIFITAWLGGELVDKFGVSIPEDTELDLRFYNKDKKAA